MKHGDHGFNVPRPCCIFLVLEGKKDKTEFIGEDTTMNIHIRKTSLS